MTRPRIALALGSGGLKAMAHIGVLRALEEAEIRPSIFAGSSAGALVAAAAASGLALGELEAVAQRVQRDRVFQIDYPSLLRYGFRTPALYRNDPLVGLCNELFDRATFRSLATPLLVSTVEVVSGRLVWWGAPGHLEASVAQAVYASCAMPGLLPPGRIGTRLCMDGAVRDPLALGAIGANADLVIAVSLDGHPLRPWESAAGSPAPRLWWHAQSLVMQDLSRHMIERWDGPPLIVIRPDVGWVHSLRGGDPRSVIQAGYEATREALSQREGPVVALH